MQGFLGASADGSYAYFVANGVLAPGASPGGLERRSERLPKPPPTSTSATPALTTFVAQLEGGDCFRGDPANWRTVSELKTSRVADDGTLVFASSHFLDLSGHDHGNASCNERRAGCREFYRYTPADEGLACITCNPTGPPSSNVELASDTGYFLGTAPRSDDPHPQPLRRRQSLLLRDRRRPGPGRHQRRPRRL